MANADWGVQLEPVDWTTVEREPFRRAFLELPETEAPDAAARRQALGIRVEEGGGAHALPPPAASFEELGVLPGYALAGLQEHGIISPMPIQAQALPLVLAGCDVIGLAQTGSGKTLAFLLPAVVHIEAQPPLAWRAATPIVLVLAPTRELAVQIGDEAGKVLRRSREGNHRSGVWSVCLYGGARRQDQLRSLSWGAHIVVATPGRLIDFVGAGAVSLERTTYLVLDEADRMLDFGFQGEVAALADRVRPERQVLFFSATWSSEVQSLARGLCHAEAGGPVRLSVGQHDDGGDSGVLRAREGIVQEVVVVDCPEDYKRQYAEKERLLDGHLRRVLEASVEHKVLVFVSQKQFADELAANLWEAGFTAGAMHGGKSQDSRLWTLDQFRKGELQLLVATDVIGRGIDIPSVSHVVVFDMGSVDDYVHRIGRTARGRDGRGHALVFFEYWRKEPGIAAELIAVLEASSQPVPEELRRIAREVERGERDVAVPAAGRGGWWGAGGGAWDKRPGRAAWGGAAAGAEDGWGDTADAAADATPAPAERAAGAPEARAAPGGTSGRSAVGEGRRGPGRREAARGAAREASREHSDDAEGGALAAPAAALDSQAVGESWRDQGRREAARGAAQEASRERRAVAEVPGWPAAGDSWRGQGRSERGTAEGGAGSGRTGGSWRGQGTRDAAQGAGQEAPRERRAAAEGGTAERAAAPPAARESWRGGRCRGDAARGPGQEAPRERHASGKGRAGAAPRAAHAGDGLRGRGPGASVAVRCP